jgi:hypothetical protein
MTPFVRSLSNLNNPSNVKGVEKGKGGGGGGIIIKKRQKLCKVL